MIFGFQGAPNGAPKFEETSVLQAIRGISTVVNRMMTGKINATLEVTLRASQTTTVVEDARITTGSFIDFDPLTANAATEKAAGTIYVLDANRKNGQITITHASAVSTDRTYKLLFIG